MIFLGARRSGHVARGSQKGQRGRGQAARSSRPRSATPATPLGDTISRADEPRKEFVRVVSFRTLVPGVWWFSTCAGTGPGPFGPLSSWSFLFSP